MSFCIRVPITGETCSRYINLEGRKNIAYKVYISYVTTSTLSRTYGDVASSILMSNFLQPTNNFQAVNSNIIGGGSVLGMTELVFTDRTATRLSRLIEDDTYITINSLPASGFYSFFKTSLHTSMDRVYSNTHFSDGIVVFSFEPL